MESNTPTYIHIISERENNLNIFSLIDARMLITPEVSIKTVLFTAPLSESKHNLLNGIPIENKVIFDSFTIP